MSAGEVNPNDSIYPEVDWATMSVIFNGVPEPLQYRSPSPLPVRAWPVSDKIRILEQYVTVPALQQRYPNAVEEQGALTDEEFETRYNWTRAEQRDAVKHHGWDPSMDESLAHGGAWTVEMDQSLGDMVSNPHSVVVWTSEAGWVIPQDEDDSKTAGQFRNNYYGAMAELQQFGDEPQSPTQ